MAIAKSFLEAKIEQYEVGKGPMRWLLGGHPQINALKELVNSLPPGAESLDDEATLHQFVNIIANTYSFEEYKTLSQRISIDLLDEYLKDLPQDDAPQIRRGLSELDAKGIVSPQNITNVIAAGRYSFNVVCGLEQLIKDNLLTEENRTTVCAGGEHAPLSADILGRLSRASILIGEYRSVLNVSENVQDIYSAAVLLEEHKIFTQENVNLFLAALSRDPVATKNYFNTVALDTINNPRDSKLFEREFKKLKSAAQCEATSPAVASVFSRPTESSAARQPSTTPGME